MRLWSPKAGQAVSAFLMSLPCPEACSRQPTASRPQAKDAARPLLPPGPQGAPRSAAGRQLLRRGRARPPETHPQSDVPSRRAREPRVLPSHASVSPQNGKAASGGAGLSPAFSRNVRHEQACFLRPARPFLGVCGSRVLLNHSPQRVNAASLTRCVCELFKTLMLSFIIICNSCPG